MELTAEHISFIRLDISNRGVTMDDLADSLVDHICCAIENDPGTDFHNAYCNALGAFGIGGLQKIQDETTYLLILKREIIMKKTMFVLGYIAAFLSTTGLLFKVQHWPGASIMLTLGIVLLNFGFLPMYFMQRYKQAVN
ncbi:MAG TPA: hypothetical protein VGB50_03490 [Flavobacterium sp.]|jgi:hypothetical protein